jgi:hypothetical protein
MALHSRQRGPMVLRAGVDCPPRLRKSPVASPQPASPTVSPLMKQPAKASAGRPGPERPMASPTKDTPGRQADRAPSCNKQPDSVDGSSAMAVQKPLPRGDSVPAAAAGGYLGLDHVVGVVALQQVVHQRRQRPAHTGHPPTSARPPLHTRDKPVLGSARRRQTSSPMHGRLTQQRLIPHPRAPCPEWGRAGAPRPFGLGGRSPECGFFRHEQEQEGRQEVHALEQQGTPISPEPEHSTKRASKTAQGSAQSPRCSLCQQRPTLLLRRRLREGRAPRRVCGCSPGSIPQSGCGGQTL